MISISITNTGITVSGSVVGSGSVSVSIKRGTRKPVTVVIQGTS